MNQYTEVDLSTAFHIITRLFCSANGGMIQLPAQPSRYTASTLFQRRYNVRKSKVETTSCAGWEPGHGKLKKLTEKTKYPFFIYRQPSTIFDHINLNNQFFLIEQNRLLMEDFGFALFCLAFFQRGTKKLAPQGYFVFSLSFR